MSTLVFDIETVGEKWGDLDAVTQATLTRWIDRSTTDEADRQAKYTDLKEGLGFSPLTGQVVAIGVYDVERMTGAVYYQGNGEEVDEPTDDFIYKQRSERQMLEDFWEGARSYDTFVTFNGRCFDVPFLMHRSAISRVQPTKNLMEGRYPYQQKTVRHVDLQDEMSFYGAQQRRPNLHLCCRAYGIESPKSGGVAGDDVAELFARKQFRDIAMYNARDVIATTALYQKWQEYFDFTPKDIDF